MLSNAKGLRWRGGGAQDRALAALLGEDDDAHARRASRLRVHSG